MLLRKYQTGGPVVVDSTPKPIDVWEGDDKWGEYQKSLASKKQYDKFNNEGVAMSDSGDFTDATPLTTQQFQAANSQFTNLEGATGVTRYKYDSNKQGGYTPQEYVFSDPTTGYTYVPSYDKPTTNYNVIEDPAITAKKEEGARWEKANTDAGIKGYRKVRYPVVGSPGKWDYELTPIKGNQEVPTDGSFVDYKSVGGNDVYKIVGGAPVASNKRGGLLKAPRFKNGGLLNSDIKELVEFGNYLLSKERAELVSKTSEYQVGDWDLSNHFGNRYKNNK
mgnify:CR=1 FL=1